MTLDQMTYIRGIHGVDINVIEIHEKDLVDKVSRGNPNIVFFLVVCFVNFSS